MLDCCFGLNLIAQVIQVIPREAPQPSSVCPMLGDLPLTWKNKRLWEIQWKVHLAEQWVEASWRTWVVLLTTGKKRVFHSEDPSRPASGLWHPPSPAILRTSVLNSKEELAAQTDAKWVESSLKQTHSCRSSQAQWGSWASCLWELLPATDRYRVCPTCWLLPILGLVPACRAGLSFAMPSCPRWWHQQWANLTCLPGLCCWARQVCLGETKGQTGHAGNRANMTALWQTLSQCKEHPGSLRPAAAMFQDIRDSWPCGFGQSSAPSTARWASGVSDLLSCPVTKESHTSTAVITSFSRILLPLTVQRAGEV